MSQQENLMLSTQLRYNTEEYKELLRIVFLPPLQPNLRSISQKDKDLSWTM